MGYPVGSFPPFGDDEDANRAVRAAMSLTADLINASALLDLMKKKNLRPEKRETQRLHVETLRAELHGRADAVHVGHAEFVAACEKELSTRLRRKVAVTPPAARREPIDETARSMQMAIYDAEIFEEAKQTLATAANERLEKAREVTRAAHAALAAHIAAQVPA